MNVRIWTTCMLLLAGTQSIAEGPGRTAATQKGGRNVIALPKPQTQGGMTLCEALAKRRSVRQFATKGLSLEQIGQLCWAGQGITDKAGGYRTAPSAGALYPLRLMVATADGLYAYLPKHHALQRISDADVRPALEKAALHQEWVGAAGAVFLVCADVSITAAKYRSRAERYVWIEVGHVGQNILLQATGMGLGAVPVGAFEDPAVARILGLEAGWRCMYILPVGVAR